MRRNPSVSTILALVLAYAALAAGGAREARAQNPSEPAVTEGRMRVCRAIDRDLAPLILAAGDTGPQIAAALDAWRGLRCGEALGRAETSCAELEAGWRAMIEDNRRFAARGLRKPYKAWVFARQADFWAPIGCTLNLNGDL